MGLSLIEWTDRTVNPIRARLNQLGKLEWLKPESKARLVGHYCEKVSPGCANCYSSAEQARFGLPPFEAKYRKYVDVFFDERQLRTVLACRIPQKWFWCDMTDLFGAWVPDEWIDQCFAVMALTPQHTHQVLTKRPDRMRAYMETRDWSNAANAITDQLRRRLDGPLYLGGEIVPPLPNVWLGTSVESSDYVGRIDDLRATRASRRFVSFEPLLGDLGDLDLTGIAQAIFGGESSKRKDRARPCDVAWIGRGVERCGAFGTARYVKQLGAVPMMAEDAWHALPSSPLLSHRNHDRVPAGFVPLAIDHPKGGGEMSAWPAALAKLRVREFPR